ncbi:hypothetical protein BSL78_19653 [Apostichopus japonicus]|uniref:Uncharacterized protein n=1 Tax=Stichopus japonicus TaxID=307972 RepID=A0A2G8K655_STIJA|nr:hypothetical protein BSL78_19653 [Apostichopus japonicus]
MILENFHLFPLVDATDVELRLFGGIVSSEGILQIRCDPNDEWKGFCGGAQWDARDCHVVCLQLGHKICSRWGYDESTSGNVSSDVISANLYCGFNELQLLDCDMSWEDQCDVEAYGLAWMSCSIDIEILGSESYLCGSDHTCVNQCGKWKRNEGCNCDEACVQFHDCCFDYDDVCTSEDDFEIQELTHSKYSDPNLLPSYECIKTGLITENDAYVLISKCPPGFNQPGTVQYCEHDSTHLEDMFLRTPVYDENGLVFSNVYCAICHGRKVTDVQGWTISVISTPGEPLLYDTVFEVRLPIGRLYKPSANTELGKARLCVSTWNRSTSCQRPPSDASITQSSAKCDLYFAPISTLIDGENKRFRNADCLLCSGLLGGKGLPPPEGAGPCVSYTNYRCHADGHLPCGRLVHTRSRSTLASTPLNFSFSELDRYGQRAGKLCSNEDGESYDPFVKNCRVLQCPRYFLHYGNKCLPSSVPDDFKIKTRLAGNESNRGFVQVQHTNGKWYTAVDTLFNDTESMVLCRELGLDFEPIIHVIKGKDDRELYTLKLECHGNETSMNDCHLSFNQKLAADVITGNRVYVRCLNTSSYSIRLYGGILASEGFVQIRYESEWFFINGDTLHWDYRDGTVVCWELNLRYCASTDKRQLRSFNDSSSVIRRQVVCNGKHRNETFKSCLGQPEYLTSVNRLAWVTCAITQAVIPDTGIGVPRTCFGNLWQGTNDAKETIYHQCGVTIINLSLEEDVLLQTTHCNYEKDIVESTAELCQMTTDINVATYEYQPTVEYFSSTFTNDSVLCWRDLMANLTCSLSHSEPWSSNADELKLTFDSKLLIPDYLFSSIQRPTDLNPNYTIWICSYNDNNLISEIIETFTDICYAISVGVTFLALLTFFKFSQQLGNVAERCRINLIMTLSMAYVFHFLNRVLGEHDVICQLIAMCSHYIWNVFWLWICIPFYKMVYKYKQQLTQSPFTFRETGKTMRYMFLAWGLPLALTLICVFLSQCHCTPTAYEIQYMGDGDHCFVAGYLAVLVTVIFPAGMVMLYAVFCLVYSFRALLKHKPLQTNCQKATGAHAELLSEIRDNFVLYIALCITCGVGFMNHIWPSSLLGIVFSLLRAVHGTLVAVIFMVRRNAKALWFDALLTEKLTKE